MTTNLTLEGLASRVEKLERAVFGGRNAASMGISPPASRTPVDGLPGHIINLRGHKAFKSPMTANEVQEKLQSTYACSVDRVAMALLRLQRKKMLRKTSKLVGKKKQVAYVW